MLTAWTTALALTASAQAAPAGMVPRQDAAPAKVQVDVLVQADRAPDDDAARALARGSRRAFEITHGAGLWPVSWAVTPSSLEAMLRVDPGLAELVAEVQPVVLLVGDPGRDDGLGGCATLGRLLDLVPAYGGGEVGDLLREDTPLLAWAREREERGLVLAGGLVPPARLVSVPRGAAPGPPEAQPWQRAWQTAHGDKHGVPLKLEDAETALSDLARMAALAASLGLDPFAVPDLDRFLRADLRRPQPPHRWSPVPLSVERAALLRRLETEPDATLRPLGAAAAVLARQVLTREGPRAEVGARVAELPTSSRFSTTQVLRAADLGAGPVGAATTRQAQELVTVLLDAAPHVGLDPAVAIAAEAQWAHRARARWPDALGASVAGARALTPEEMRALQRAFKRRDQRRRAARR